MNVQGLLKSLRGDRAGAAEALGIARTIYESVLVRVLILITGFAGTF